MGAANTEFDVIVIGGGASGMVAAGRAAELGKRVLLVEKNATLGEKLKISGGGRCNITNAEPDVHKFLANYGKTGQFMHSAFAQFSVTDTYTFFEKLGLPLVEQAHKRVFPKTERAADVVDALKRYMDAGGVTVVMNAAVSQVLHEGNRITGIAAGGTTYTAHSYIVATGGLSHPETGSTGDGFNWLKDLGHNVASPTPMVVPIAIKEHWGHVLSGVSLPNGKVTFYVDGVKQVTKKGPMLFTHFGLSGPTILNLSKVVADLLPTGDVTATIDSCPELDHGALNAKIVAVFDANKNKAIKNVIDEIVAPGLAKGIWELLPTLDPETKVHSVTKEQRKQLVDTLKALPLTVTGLLGFDKAVVVDGGVPLTEIDTKTMRSTIVENLFVTGDLLHINRPSGGFSLQLCWTTGFVAGTYVSDNSFVC